MAIEPSAVTIQLRSEIAPTWAMFVGSMMMPEPIMFTATSTVSWTSVIFFAGAVSAMVDPRWLMRRVPYAQPAARGSAGKILRRPGPGFKGARERPGCP